MRGLLRRLAVRQGFEPSGSEPSGERALSLALDGRSAFALRATADNLRVSSPDAACQPKPRAQRAFGEGWR
jgi:hypothetical protein